MPGLVMGAALGIQGNPVTIDIPFEDDFNTDTSGDYTSGGSGVASVTGDRLRVTNGAAQVGYVYILLKVDVGVTISAAFDVIAGTSAAQQIRFGTSAYGFEYASVSTAGNGQTVSFVTTSTDLYVTMRAGGSTSGQYSEYDNLIVERASTPLLTNPTAAKSGETGATNLGVDTNEDNGILYWGIYPSASTPDNDDVIAGTGATLSDSQSVAASGTQSVPDQVQLAASTAYRAHYVHVDRTGNKSAVSTSLAFTTDAATGFSVSNQTVEIGADTLSGAGGIIPTYTGTPAAAFQISGLQSANYNVDTSTGEITPASDHAATDGDQMNWGDGTTSAVITVTAAADTYHCKADGAEIDAVNIDHVLNNSTAKTTLIRGGTVTNLATGDAGSGFLDERTWLNRDYSTKPMTIKSADTNDKAVFQNWRALVHGSDSVYFDDLEFQQTGTSFTSSYISDGGFATTNNIRITNCVFSGRNLDVLLDWYNTDGTAYLPSGFVLSSTSNAVIEDNTFVRLNIIGSFRLEGTVSVQRNDGSLCYFDLYNMVGHSTSDSGRKTIKDNTGWGVFGARWNVGAGPHGDGFQQTGGIINNAIFENCAIFMGDVGVDHNGDDQQTWFTNFTVQNSQIIGCLFAGQALHGITIPQIEDVVIAYCTVMENDPDDPVGQQLLPTANLGQTSAAGVIDVYANVFAQTPNLYNTGSAEYHDNDNTVVNVIGTGGAELVSDSFPGPFSPNTLAKALTAFTPKGASAITAIGAVTTGGAFRSGPYVPAACNAPALSASGTTITVDTSETIWDGESSVTSTDLRYSTDQSTWTEVSGVTLPHDITGLSESTTYYVQVRQNNAVGNGRWSESDNQATGAGAGAAVNYIGVNTAVNPGTAAVTHTNAADQAGTFFVALNTRHSGTITSVVLDGVTMTRVGTGVSSVSNDDAIRTYIATTTGAGNLVVTFSDSTAVVCQTTSWRISGYTSTGLIESVSTNATSFSQSVTLTSVPDGAAMFCIANRNGGGADPITATSGITRDHTAAIGSSSMGFGGQALKSGTGNHTMTIGYGADNGDEIMVGIALPAS